MMKVKFMFVLLQVFTLTFASLGVSAGLYSDCPHGYTCFVDDETGQFGKVQGDNQDWGNFGWRYRGDYFYNKGRTHHNCLYSTTYHGYWGGYQYLLLKGEVITWRNAVASNDWTREYRC